MRPGEFFYRELASRLWLLLQERGCSERELAEKIGVRPRTVRRWLEGKSRILYGGTISAIVDALGCRWEDLFPGCDHRIRHGFEQRRQWVLGLADQGFGPADIGRHIGLNPELVHLLLERHYLASVDKPEHAMN